MSVDQPCQDMQHTEGNMENEKDLVNVETTKLETWRRGENTEYVEIAEPPWYISLMVGISFRIMFWMGYFADFLRHQGVIRVEVASDDKRHKGFAPLDNDFQAVYSNHIYRKCSDCFERPVGSVPGNSFALKERVTNDYGWTYTLTGADKYAVNMGSYNYLGFSRNYGSCAENAVSYIDRFGIHIGGSRHEKANHVNQRQLEQYVANYLGVEDAICFPMGFGTNSMNIPALVDRKSLILSDRLNHASIVLGCRLSGATILTFEHNNPRHCEERLREALCKPSPKTGLPYNKILIIIEGIYSMEGTIVNLPKFIEIKKKYNAYIFIDEAHSVGALGPSGKGVAEYWGCNPTDIDIMMGTLTKSFAAAGGYIGGAKKTIDHIRCRSHGMCYGTAMSPPVVAQVLSSMEIMVGNDGSDTGSRKAVQLLRNSRYFRRKLRSMGFLVYGQDDSPVIPLMTFYITKTMAFSRLAALQNVGLVAVAFPATPINKARVRFCVSADHTKQQLDYVLKVVDGVGNRLLTKYGTPTVDDIKY